MFARYITYKNPMYHIVFATAFATDASKRKSLFFRSANLNSIWFFLCFSYKKYLLWNFVHLWILLKFSKDLKKALVFFLSFFFLTKMASFIENFPWQENSINQNNKMVPKTAVRILEEYPSKKFSQRLKPEVAIRRCSVA